MKHIFALFITFSVIQGFAQSPDNLIPRQLLFKEKDRVNVKMSMDGSTVFYQKRADGADSTLYFISTGSPLAEKKKRFEGKLVNWTPLYEGGLLALVQQDSNLQLYSTTITSSSLRKVKGFPIRSLSVLHLSSRYPNKVAVNIEAKDPGQSGIYTLDILSGSTKRLGLMGNFQQVFFDENFGMVAALQGNDDESTSIMVRRDGMWTEVIRHPFGPEMFIGGLNRIVSASKDGKTVYATDNNGKDKTTLVAIDVASGSITEIVSDPDADILPFGGTIDPQGRPTSAVALFGATKRHIVDEGVRADFDFLNKELNNMAGFAAASQNDSTWLVRRLDGGPYAYYAFDRPTKKLTLLFKDHTPLNDYDLATRTAHVVTTRDGLSLPVQVYVPPGMSRTDGMPKVALPTIIYVHGGPWAGVTFWNSWFHTRNFQLLANRGYAVVVMEFRGTTGLGKRMTEAGNLQWGAAMHNDILDVATWAIKSGIANRKRLGIWGWSYGGYATNFAMCAAPDMFACGVSMYGISDLYEFCKLPFADNNTWRIRVGDPNTEAGAALLKQHSPTTYLKDIANPILLTTGSMDDRVPQAQSDKFAAALDKAGKEVVYFFYPEEGHDYAKPESWASFWAVAEYFLHQNLGGRKEARGADIETGNFEAMYGSDYIDDID